MENQNEKTAITPESVLASVREMLKESGLAFDRKLEQSRIESDKRNKEWNESLKRSRAKSDRDMKRSEAKFDREMKRRADEFDRDMKQSEVKFDRDLKKSADAFDRQVKYLNELIGGVSKSNGMYAEEFFYNAFENGKRNFFGETFDNIERNIKGIIPGYNDEYDMLLLNGQSVGVIEVKYRARLDDIPKIIKKANTFRANFPHYSRHRVYLGLASMIFNQRLEQECVKNGVAIVKHVGKALVVNDDHLKAY